MMLRLPFRSIPSVVGAVATGALSVQLGAPLPAALPAIFVGGLCGWLLWREPERIAPSAAVERPDPFAAALPILDAFMAAIDEPMLLIERQTVTLANESALALLGRHIVGEDARVAIRHPSVAEKLIGRNGHDDDATAFELSGIGGSDRHWSVSIHAIDATRRLVRLADRTGSQQAERMRVDFVANASHELRTPLATLIGFIETLEDVEAANDAATRERFLKIMAGEAKRMLQLVNDLISLSRIEAEKFTLAGEPVVLAPLLREIADVLRTPRVRIEVDGDLAVNGDRAQLSQLLHNLIGNAVKYGRPDTPIQVRAEHAGPMIRITVADEGEGIAPEHVPRLTERFYRVDPGRSRAMGGTGLGLAIVKHIVERHRGKLEIHSLVGIGTTVTVLLPSAIEALSS